MSDNCVKVVSLDQEFKNLKDVFSSSKIKSGDTILLLDDVIVDEIVIIDKSCHIDLDNHYIFVSVSEGLTIKGGCSVSFDNGSIQTLSDITIEDAIISQGVRTSVTLSENLHVETNGTAIHARRRGGFIVDGASIKTIGDTSAVYVDDGASSLLVNDGVIMSYMNSALSIRNGGNAVINSGRLYTESKGSTPEISRPAIIVNGNNSKVTVNGGSIFSDDSTVIQEQFGSTVEITGGEIFNKSSMWPAVELNGENTFLYMSGGHVYSIGTYAFMANETEVGSVQSIQVSGGKVGSGKDVVLTVGKGDHGVVFSGGFVKGNLDRQYLAEGYGVSDIKDDEGYAEIIIKNIDDDEDIGFNVFDVDDQIVTQSIQDSPQFSQSVSSIESKDLGDPTLPDSPLTVDATSNDSSLPEFIDSGLSEENQLDTEHLDDTPVLDTLPEVSLDASTEENIVFNQSTCIKNKIMIYRTPSTKFPISEWSGVFTVLERNYFNYNNQEFALVRFKLPGSGRKSVGYVLMVDILNP